MELTQKQETSGEPLKIQHGKHPNTLANLVKGRAKIAEMRSNGELTNSEGYSLTSALKYSLSKPVSQPALDAPARDHVVYQTIQGALKREPTPFKEVWDRVDGRLDNLPQGITDNRVINFIISGEQGKELIEGISERLTKQEG